MINEIKGIFFLMAHAVVFFSHVCYQNNLIDQLSQYRDSLRAGGSGDRIPVGARFSAPVQTGPGVHPASSFSGGKAARAWH